MNSRHRVKAVRFMVRALILAGFSFYITYLIRTGNMVYYIAPRMEIYVKLTAVGLYLVAAYQAFLALQSLNTKRTEDCGCGCESHRPSRSRFRSFVIYGLFLFPLLLGFVMPDTALNSSLAAKRGVNFGPSPSQLDTLHPVDKDKSPAEEWSATAEDRSPEWPVERPGDESLTDEELDNLFPADDYLESFANLAKSLYLQEPIIVKEEGFIEILSSIDLFVEPFLGKTIEFSGFVYREETMRADQFALARFQIQCCSADALPFGIMVQYDRAQSYATDSWVKVTGTVGQTPYNDLDIMKVDAVKIEKVDAPSTPYVYPNYDYFYNH